jgi:hypothetical protein
MKITDLIHSAHRCRSSLAIDGKEAASPRPLYGWPRRRIFPSDPTADSTRVKSSSEDDPSSNDGDGEIRVEREDLPYYIVQDGGGVEYDQDRSDPGGGPIADEAASGNGTQGSGAGGEGGDADGVNAGPFLWRVWLLLPRLKPGAQLIRVPSLFCTPVF